MGPSAKLPLLSSGSQPLLRKGLLQLLGDLGGMKLAGQRLPSLDGLAARAARAAHAALCSATSCSWPPISVGSRDPETFASAGRSLRECYELRQAGAGTFEDGRKAVLQQLWEALLQRRRLNVWGRYTHKSPCRKLRVPWVCSH